MLQQRGAAANSDAAADEARADPKGTAELEASLSSLPEAVLLQQARQTGVSAFDIAEAEAAEDTKEALVFLLVEEARCNVVRGGRANKPGSTQSGREVRRALASTAQALMDESGQGDGRQDVGKSLGVEDAERRYIPQNQGAGMEISPVRSARYFYLTFLPLSAHFYRVPQAEARRRKLDHMARSTKEDNRREEEDEEEESDEEESESGDNRGSRLTSYTAPPEGALARSRRIYAQLRELGMEELSRRVRMESKNFPQAALAKLGESIAPRAELIDLLLEHELKQEGEIALPADERKNSLSVSRPDSPTSELQSMKLSALRKRAVASGVSDEQIEEAYDASDMRECLVRLILDAEAELSCSAAAPEEIKPEPEKKPRNYKQRADEARTAAKQVDKWTAATNVTASTAETNYRIPAMFDEVLVDEPTPKKQPTPPGHAAPKQ